MKKKFLFVLLLGILITGITGFFAGQAHAINIGDTLMIEWLYPDTGTTYASWTVVVGPGVEVPNAGGFGAIDIDVDGTTPEIEIDFTSSTSFASGSFNGFRFFDTLSSIADFADVTIFSSNMAGFNASRLSFDSDNIYVNFQGLSFDSSTLVQIDVDVEPIPEPATMLLLGSGLVGLAGFRKKYKK